MRDDTREFGNKEGLSIADKLSSLKEELNVLKGRIRHLKPYADHIMAVRAAILDDTSGTIIQSKRNEVAHGGNILADLECIEAKSKSDQAKAYGWRQSFETLYGLAYRFAYEYLPKSEENPVIEAIDIRTNVRYLHIWTKAENPAVMRAAEEIDRICSVIIDEWSTPLVKGNPIPETSAVIEEQLDSIRSLYQGHVGI